MVERETIRACSQFVGITLFLVLAAPSANAAAGYLYVGDYDPTATTEASVNIPVNAQTGLVSTEHSLFEMSMSNQTGSSGNIIEIGVTTDPSLNGNLYPHWFVSSWVNGTWKGYNGNSDFISDIGNFWT